MKLPGTSFRLQKPAKGPNPQPVFFPQSYDTAFHIHVKRGKITLSCMLILMLLHSKREVRFWSTWQQPWAEFNLLLISS
jgi:hypothetical protein